MTTSVPLLKYYTDTTLFNLLLSILVGLYAGVIWSLLTFASMGTLIGFMVFGYFKRNEYYLYHNFGYTKVMLMKRVWGVNLIFALLGLGVYGLILKLL